MDIDKFIEPREVEINGRAFITSDIPALASLDICNAVTKAIADNGLIGIAMLPAQTDRAILRYTALNESGVRLCPDTDQLFSDIFKGHMGDAKTLVAEMVKRNYGFLIHGDLLERLADLQGATVSDS